MSYKRLLLLAVWLSSLLVACSSIPDTVISYDPASLRFSGEQAFVTQAAFVERFPYRHTGAPNNRLAVEWIRDQLAGHGLDCAIDE